MSKSDIRKELLTIRNNLADKDALSKSINNKVIEFITNLAETALKISNSIQCLGDSRSKSGMTAEIKTHSKLKVASFISLPNEINTSLINSAFEVYLPIVHPTIKHGLWFVKDNSNYYYNKYKIKVFKWFSIAVYFLFLKRQSCRYWGADWISSRTRPLKRLLFGYKGSTGTGSIH